MTKKNDYVAYASASVRLCASPLQNRRLALKLRIQQEELAQQPVRVATPKAAAGDAEALSADFDDAATLVKAPGKLTASEKLTN